MANQAANIDTIVQAMAAAHLKLCFYKQMEALVEAGDALAAGYSSSAVDDEVGDAQEVWDKMLDEVAPIWGSKGTICKKLDRAFANLKQQPQTAGISLVADKEGATLRCYSRDTYNEIAQALIQGKYDGFTQRREDEQEQLNRDKLRQASFSNVRLVSNAPKRSNEFGGALMAGGAQSDPLKHFKMGGVARGVESDDRVRSSMAGYKQLKGGYTDGRDVDLMTNSFQNQVTFTNHQGIDSSLKNINAKKESLKAYAMSTIGGKNFQSYKRKFENDFSALQNIKRVKVEDLTNPEHRAIKHMDALKMLSSGVGFEKVGCNSYITDTTTLGMHPNVLSESPFSRIAARDEHFFAVSAVAVSRQHLVPDNPSLSVMENARISQARDFCNEMTKCMGVGTENTALTEYIKKNGETIAPVATYVDAKTIALIEECRAAGTARAFSDYSMYATGSWELERLPHLCTVHDFSEIYYRNNDGAAKRDFIMNYGTPNFEETGCDRAQPGWRQDDPACYPAGRPVQLNLPEAEQLHDIRFCVTTRISAKKPHPREALSTGDVNSPMQLLFISHPRLHDVDAYARAHPTAARHHGPDTYIQNVEERRFPHRMLYKISVLGEETQPATYYTIQNTLDSLALVGKTGKELDLAEIFRRVKELLGSTAVVNRREGNLYRDQLRIECTKMTALNDVFMKLCQNIVSCEAMERFPDVMYRFYSNRNNQESWTLPAAGDYVIRNHDNAAARDAEAAARARFFSPRYPERNGYIVSRRIENRNYNDDIPEDNPAGVDFGAESVRGLESHGALPGDIHLGMGSFSNPRNMPLTDPQFIPFIWNHMDANYLGPEGRQFRLVHGHPNTKATMPNHAAWMYSKDPWRANAHLSFNRNEGDADDAHPNAILLTTEHTNAFITSADQYNVAHMTGRGIDNKEVIFWHCDTGIEVKWGIMLWWMLLHEDRAIAVAPWAAGTNYLDGVHRKLPYSDFLRWTKHFNRPVVICPTDKFMVNGEEVEWPTEHDWTDANVWRAIAEKLAMTFLQRAEYSACFERVLGMLGGSECRYYTWERSPFTLNATYCSSYMGLPDIHPERQFLWRHRGVDGECWTCEVWKGKLPGYILSLKFHADARGSGFIDDANINELKRSTPEMKWRTYALTLAKLNLAHAYFNRLSNIDSEGLAIIEYSSMLCTFERSTEGRYKAWENSHLVGAENPFKITRNANQLSDIYCPYARFLMTWMYFNFLTVPNPIQFCRRNLMSKIAGIVKRTTITFNDGDGGDHELNIMERRERRPNCTYAHIAPEGIIGLVPTTHRGSNLAHLGHIIKIDPHSECRIRGSSIIYELRTQLIEDWECNLGRQILMDRDLATVDRPGARISLDNVFQFMDEDQIEIVRVTQKIKFDKMPNYDPLIWTKIPVSRELWESVNPQNTGCFSTSPQLVLYTLRAGNKPARKLKFTAFKSSSIKRGEIWNYQYSYRSTYEQNDENLYPLDGWNRPALPAGNKNNGENMFKLFTNTDPKLPNAIPLSTMNHTNCFNYQFVYEYNGLRQYTLDKVLLQQLNRQSNVNKDAMTRCVLMWQMGMQKDHVALPCHDGSGEMDLVQFQALVESILGANLAKDHSQEAQIKKTVEDMFNKVAVKLKAIVPEIAENGSKINNAEQIGGRADNEEKAQLDAGGAGHARGKGLVDEALKDKPNPKPPKGKPPAPKGKEKDEEKEDEDINDPDK